MSRVATWAGNKTPTGRSGWTAEIVSCDEGFDVCAEGDGGIDGVISLDRLGLEKVYVQAKRWQGSVGRPEVQAFYGALAGQRANTVSVSASQSIRLSAPLMFCLSASAFRQDS